ncbi:aspartic proteinase-like isoform X2 [Vicia villosa]|uniref:aspartic proteinase-like isoform X2 n=1 Tax=Vicia villosa TaxID=3911 RepID=UPI00273B3AEC|nr:aspartic proteinase-like isoform X2 [Vicia villosa]
MLISVVTVRGRRRGEIVFGGVDYAHYKKNWQIIITMINHAIGASRVVRKECKTIIAKYGQTIMDLLLYAFFLKSVPNPKIGWCAFDSTRGVK